jgi:hypothetical protein
VIEVAHSQRRKNLDYLADDYILGSDGKIRMMIGLDLDYPGVVSKRATLSVYTHERLQVVEHDEHNSSTTTTDIELHVRRVIVNQVGASDFDFASSTRYTGPG